MMQCEFQLEFAAEKMSNAYAYVGLDSIRLIDPESWQDMCQQQLGLTSSAPKYGQYATLMNTVVIKSHSTGDAAVEEAESSTAGNCVGRWSVKQSDTRARS